MLVLIQLLVLISLQVNISNGGDSDVENDDGGGDGCDDDDDDDDDSDDDDDITNNIRENGDLITINSSTCQTV